MDTIVMTGLNLMYNWQTKIQYVRGVGPTKATELKSMGIETVGDLLEYQPNHHIYPGITAIKDLKEGHAIIKAKIVSIDRLPGRTPIVEAKLNDGTGTCKAMWWNQIFILQNLRPGMTVTFWGKYKAGVLQQPKFSTYGLMNLENITGGDYGVHNRTMKIALKEVLSSAEIPNISGGVPTLETFRSLHSPKNNAEYKKALELLKFNELLLLSLAMLKRRQQARSGGASVIPFNTPTDQKISGYFPYKFTLEQNKAIGSIVLDLHCTVPMNRLLHGEVGSGKTAVAFYAAMLAALNGKRTLILCPTTILAQQHYDTLRDMGWDDVELRLSHTNKIKIDKYCKSIVIGTHSILNCPMLLKSASLVIIDEFQKFGVEQRAKIQKHNPHTLLMSATPIPRTLAMSVFGDLDVTVIRELPIKRGPVVTRWVLPLKREQMYEIIEKELVKGKQVYVVYPRIDGGEDVESAERGFRKICKRFWDDYDVQLLTGRAPQESKTEVLRSFREGHTDILVSTIIAEVGLDNPNASVMVIEGADRFGLSQLHQLRGRICRSKDTTFCFMVSNTANEKSIARLDVMEKCNDGFEVAEYDLRLRGPGEMFSTRQHGLPDLKFASLLYDYDLLVKARELAGEYIGKLDEPSNVGIKQMLEIKYGDTIKLGEIA
jgi:ATP-dependent DNA helicase RecG